MNFMMHIEGKTCQTSPLEWTSEHEEEEACYFD